MSGTLTNGFDIVVMISAAELTRSLRGSNQLMLSAGIPGLALGAPTVTLDAPPGQAERVTATMPITIPYAGTSLTGTLAVGERLTVRPVAGRPRRREVVLDFTRAGAPDLVEIVFSAASLDVLGTSAADVVKTVEDQVRGRLRDTVKAVTLTQPGGVPVFATPGTPFTATDLQARVIVDRTGADADALAFLVRTCGPDPAGPPPDASAFTTSLVPAGGAAAVVVSNWPVLRCGIRQALIDGRVLGLTPADFDPVPACALAGAKGIVAAGHTAVLTSFAATVPPGVNGVVVTGGILKNTAAYTATAAFTATITLNVVTAADGTQAVVPVVSTPVVTASISLAWWVYVGIGLGAAYFGGIAAAAVALIVTGVVDAVADAVLASLVGSGIGGPLRGLAGISFPLGPAATGLMIDTLVLDDLTITGQPVLRQATPMLRPVDNTGAPAATASALSTPVVGATAPLPVFLHNLGSTAVTVEELLLDDPDRAFTAGAGTALPWRIPAGARFEALGCEFHPPREGPFTATLALLTDDPGGHVVPVELTGTGAPTGPHGRLTVRPTAIDFGDCLLGDTVARPVTVDNVGDADAYFSVTVTGPAPATDFHGPWLVPSPVPVGASRTFNLLFAPGTTGPARASATIDVRGNSTYTEQHTITLAARAGAPVLVLDPPTLDFGVLPPRTAVTRPLTVHNAGDLDLVVRGFRYAVGGADFYVDPALAFPLTVPPGGQARVPFSTTAAVTPGQLLSNEFDVDSNDPGAQLPRPRLRTVLRTAGPRIVTTDDVDFGRVPVGGGPVRRNISLRNTGSSDLTVTAVRLTQGVSFRLLKVPTTGYTVAAGSEQLVTIEFPAARSGQYVDRVTVSSDDAARPSVSIGLAAVCA
jgi:hypothetical protein